MSANGRLQLNWEAHLEALPLATWIVRCNVEPSLSQGQYIVSSRSQCGPVFVNGVCRELLGLARESHDSERFQRYLHPEDSSACLDAWDRFLQGHSERFHQTVRWIRPDTKKTITLVVHAQRLLCGDIQGWLRSAKTESALSRLEELTNAPRA
jgi:PAS domain-containing protein